MNDAELRRALRAAAAPGELDAERRAWALVRPAFAETERVPARGRGVRAVLVLAALAALTAAAFSPPGRAVGGWVRETIGVERVKGQREARPALASLPAEGRLLVVARTGTWVVRSDGSKRRLGAYRDATWSPQGLHVAATRGRRLVAMTPDGDVRWTLTKARPVRHPAWSPSGFRVAYGAGSDLRVVNGDGEPDRLLARNVVPGSWAWRPEAGRNVLAFATAAGAVRAVDVDRGSVVWQARDDRVRLAAPARISWTADARFVLVQTELQGLLALDGRGRLLYLSGLPGAGADLAVPPRGHVIAVATRSRRRSAVTLLDLDSPKDGGRRVFAGAGRFGDVEWSPDGRWLLVGWTSADQWLFLRAPRVGRIDAVSNIGREFDPGGAGGAFPRLSGWCCPPGAR